MQVESGNPSVHERVESVLSAIGGDDAPATPATTRDERGRFASTSAPSDEPAALADADTPDSPDADGEAAEPADGADENAADTTEGEVEQAETPAIEPPEFLSAELKARFATLPADVQRELAQYEAERNQGVNRKLNEAAELRKAADAEKQQAAAERQRYAQAIDQALSLAQFNPVIQEGLQTDWLKLAREDRGAYVEKRAEFEAAVQQFQHLQAERQQVAQTQQAELVKAETAKAIEVMPELADKEKAKAFAAGVSTTLKDYGFSDAEIANVADHRILKVLRDVIRYRDGEKARVAAAAKAKAAVPKVAAPARGGDAGATRQAQRAAMLKRADQARTPMERAEALAALIPD